MWIIYRRRPRLTDETVPERLVCGQRRRQDLQRDQPTEPLIQSPEDNRHPALSDLFL